MVESTKFDPVQIQAYIEKEFDTNLLPNISEYIKIPNLSPDFDENWQTNGLQEKTANFIIDWVNKQNIKGLKSQIIQEKGHTPTLFIEIPGTDPKLGTCLFYGHFDKQPHMDGWMQGLGPITPVVKDDKLYGRGGADDGYSTFAMILTIKTLQHFNLPHPRYVGVIEGCEESGSQHIGFVLDKQKDVIGDVNMVFALDSGCIDYDSLWITSTLRGVVNVVVKVQVLKEGVHSGDASGVVPSSFRIMRQLLDRIDCSKTGEVNPIFQTDVPPFFYKQQFETAEYIGQDFFTKFPFHEKTQPTDSNVFHAYQNRVWKPQLSIVGIDGLPKPQIAGNVLRQETVCKLSLRIPPNLNPEEAKKNLIKLLTENPPYNATITIDPKTASAGSGFCLQNMEQFLQDSVEQSSKNYYGKSCKYLGEGGFYINYFFRFNITQTYSGEQKYSEQWCSIPIVNDFQNRWKKASILVTGILGPNSNAHGPNEFLHIPYCKKLICCMTQVVYDSAKHFASQ